MTPAGAAAVVTTAGNSDCHIILRGGRSGPNYGAADVADALELVAKAKLPRRLMVDASHGNSEKDHRRQPIVAEALAEQIAAGEQGLAGVMLESFLEAGRQEPGPLPRPGLRAERHRRLHGHGHHGRACSTAWPPRSARAGP